MKRVPAEFVRLASGMPPAETQNLVDDIVERQLDLLWKHGDLTRVLDPKILTRDQELLLYDKSPQSADDLRDAAEYANPTNFQKILKRLHGERLIEFTPAPAKVCVITARGIVRAEELVRKHHVV